MIIDSHCHLNYLKLENGLTLEQIIKNAKSSSVDKIITVGVAWNELEEIKNIANKFEDVFYSVGVHPSELDTHQPTAEELIKISNNFKCVAIGETGLDFFYNDKNTKKQQIDKFVNHITAGKTVKKPVIVHTRSAKQETLEVLKSERVENCGGILHCFTEDYDMAKKAIDMGMYISFSGILTFKNAKDIQEVAKKLPLDRILIETDAPYLTPTPFRGKPNYPEYVKYVGEFLANLRNEPLNLIQQQTYKNTCEVFKLNF